MKKTLIALACLALAGACANMKKGTWNAAGAPADAPKTGTLKTAWGWIKTTPTHVDGDGFHVKVEIKNTSGKPVEYLRKHVELVDANGGTHADLADKYLAENATDTALSAGTKGWSMGTLFKAAKTGAQAARKVARNAPIAPGKTHEDELTFHKDQAWGNFTLRFSKDLIATGPNEIKYTWVEQQ